MNEEQMLKEKSLQAGLNVSTFRSVRYTDKYAFNKLLAYDDDATLAYEKLLHESIELKQECIKIFEFLKEMEGRRIKEISDLPILKKVYNNGNIYTSGLKKHIYSSKNGIKIMLKWNVEMEYIVRCFSSEKKERDMYFS